MRTLYAIDVRHVLPTIGVPTLVLHRTGDLRAAALGGEFIACPFREWAVLTDKKTIPDDLLVREFYDGQRVGGNA